MPCLPKGTVRVKPSVPYRKLLPVCFPPTMISILADWREESNQSNTTIVIFAICLLMVYLLLSALYESFFVPFAVLLSVPAGLMGSFLFAKLLGLENNIYLQTGLIMLIGLLAKQLFFSPNMLPSAVVPV